MDKLCEYSRLVVCGSLEPPLVSLLNPGVDGHLLVTAPLVKLGVVDVQELQLFIWLPAIGANRGEQEKVRILFKKLNPAAAGKLLYLNLK